VARENLKNLKKKPLILEVQGNDNQKMRFFGVSNMKTFEECYTEWKTTTSNLRGEAIGSVNTKKSLFDMIKSQGKTGRKAAGDDAGAAIAGAQGSEIITLLDSVQNVEAITEKHKEDLNKALDIMTEIKNNKKSKRNPRNIRFENDPILTNKRGIRIGKGREVFGHYRTPAYEKATKKKNKYNGKTKIVTRVDSNWWNINEGEATPPMYQALYGEESEIDIGIKMSLYYCVKTALETINRTPVGASRDTPITIEKRNSWQIAKKVSGIRTIVNTWLAKPSAQGNMRKRSARAQILRTRIRLGDKGKGIIKEALGIDLDNEVKSAYFKISERQINRLAENLFNNKVENKRKKVRAIPIRQYNDLKIANFEEPKEEKEEPNKNEKNKEDPTTEKKSWSDILRRESYVEVL